VTAALVTVALLGLCAGTAAAPMDVPTRTSEFDVTPATIPGDLDFPSPLIGQEVVFDPYSDPPDESDSDSLAILPLNTTLEASEPLPAPLLALGLACLGIFVVIRRSARQLREPKKPRKPGRRKVRRELRMMA
jgi:hypothetical protein